MSRKEYWASRDWRITLKEITDERACEAAKFIHISTAPDRVQWWSRGQIAVILVQSGIARGRIYCPHRPSSRIIQNK
jgi:hypothetical protein